MKKVFSIVLMAVIGLFLVACVTDTTTVEQTTATVTTADQTTTVETTTVETTTDQTTTETPVDLVALVNDLKTNYASTLEDPNFLATTDLSLLATIGDLAITWTSNNTDYLEVDGTVHRPSFTTGNQTVVLTASITDGTNTESYGFFVTIQALDKTDQERADEVFLVATAFPAKEKWTVADEDTLEFVTDGTDDEGTAYTIVWTSSHPANLSVDAEIVQPTDADVVVTMTATITINTVDYTEDVEFTIAKIEDATDVASIADAALLGEDSYVKFSGVTINAIDSDGNVYFTDGVDVLYIYGTPFTANVGDVLDITGEFTYYYNSPQLKGTATHPIIAEASTAAAVSAPVNNPASLAALIGGLAVPTAEEPFAYEYHEVTVKIYYEETWGNYSVFLVPTDYDFSAALAEGAVQPNGDSMMMYYKGDNDVLSPLHGKEVTLTILTQGWRSDKSVYYANFFGTAADISVVFADDASAVAAALESTVYPTEIIEGTTLDMPASMFGVGLTYASDDATIIDPATGVVDLSGLATQVEVTITVTATKGLETDTKNITIKVGVLPTSTIAEALALTGKVKIEGVVTISENDGGFMVQDDTGAIYVYTYNNADLDAILAANLGNKVQIIGNRGAYNGLEQLYASEVAFIEVATIPAATNVDAMALDSVGLLPYQGYRVELTDMLVVSVDGDTNITIVLQRVSDGATISMRYDKDAVLSTATQILLDNIAAGDKITITTGLSWYNGPQLVFVDNTLVVEGTPYTDAELLAADAAKFAATVTLTEDYMVPELIYANVSAAVISVELQANLVDDLATSDSLLLTIPDGADLVGTVTFTLVYNAETTDVVVAVTLDGLTDAEKLTGDEATLSVQAAAIANAVIELPLVGDLGTTIAWSVVSGTAVLDVDGKTLTFTDATADYDVVLEATLTVGAETPVTKQFTVNVSGITIISDFSTLYTKTADVWDVANAVEVYVSGVVSEKGYNTVYLQDANGVGVKISGNSFGDLNVGDEVIIGGVLEEDGGVRQFDWNPTLVVVSSTGNTVTPVVMTADEVILASVADTGKLITLTGVEFVSGGTYYTFAVNGTSEASIELSTHGSNIPDWFDDSFVAGDTIGTLTFVFSKFYNTDLSIEALTLEQREVDEVNGDASQLPGTLTLNGDYVLPTPLYGSTYTVSEVSLGLQTYIDETTTPGTLLVLSTPAVAEVGTVTIAVAKGTTTVNVVIDVTVVEPEPVVTTGDLFISEYGEGSSNNKWIELYNPTSAAIDLSTYTLRLNSNESQVWNDFILVLSGSLAPGDVLVIVNPSANADVQLVLDNADITDGAWPNAVTIFNGDDAIGLFKDGVLIDIFGVFGEDLGSSWPVGTDSTLDHTLVRNPSVTGPSVLWDATEWTAYDINTDDYVGSHTVN